MGHEPIELGHPLARKARREARELLRRKPLRAAPSVLGLVLTAAELWARAAAEAQERDDSGGII